MRALLCVLLLSVAGWSQARCLGNYGGFAMGEGFSPGTDNHEVSTFFWGNCVTPGFSVELAFVDFALLKDRADPGNVDKLDGNEIALVKRLELTPTLDLLGRVGPFAWDAEIVEGGVDRGGKEGASWMYGTGLDYRLTRHVALRLSLTRYLNLRDHNVNLLAAGFLLTP